MSSGWWVVLRKEVWAWVPMLGRGWEGEKFVQGHLAWMKVPSPGRERGPPPILQVLILKGLVGLVGGRPRAGEPGQHNFWPSSELLYV